ncbi:MAG: hypothetical protein AAB602_02760 [Patescibacteria group bacterium]
MILASHAIIGAAVGRLFPLSPFYGFLAGLLSHYAMDAIPHWEYTLPSISKRKKLGSGNVLVREVIFTGIDFAVGIAAAFAIFPIGLEDPGILSISFGIIGGVFPDALQFLYFFYKGEPIRMHQKFHDTIHASRKFKDRPFVGIPLQIALITVFILISNFFAPI